jgi:hypothetical protein
MITKYEEKIIIWKYSNINGEINIHTNKLKFLPYDIILIFK